ncbi:MAG: ATP-binding protein [Candidatus Dormibacteria bacterium]
MQFQRATKEQAKLRLAITGTPGGGKTYTALAIATTLGGRIGLIDTEHASASKYASEFNFDTLLLAAPFHPNRYVEAIAAAADAGVDVLIIDSASHEWMGKGGCLEIVDQVARASKSGNSYVAWGQVTPLHNAFIEAILQSPMHVIATFRSKQEYAVTEGVDGKKGSVQRLGLGPVTREGAEYEFDIILDMLAAEKGRDAAGIIQKSRASAAVPQGSHWDKPGKELALAISAWLADGVEPPSEPARASADVARALGTRMAELAKDGKRDLVIQVLALHGLESLTPRQVAELSAETVAAISGDLDAAEAKLSPHGAPPEGLPLGSVPAGEMTEVPA